MSFYNTPNEEATRIPLDMAAKNPADRTWAESIGIKFHNFEKSLKNEAVTPELVSLFLVVIIASVVSARAVMLCARVGIVDHNNAIRLSSILGNFVGFSVLLWSALAISWYSPLLGFLGASILSAFIVLPSMATIWFTKHWLLDLTSISIGLYLWIGHWPFK
jgi:hypothetical protein